MMYALLCHGVINHHGPFFSSPDIDHCFRFLVFLLHFSHAIGPRTFQVSSRWQSEQLTKCYCTRHECPVLQKQTGKQLSMPVSSVFIFVCFKWSPFNFYGLFMHTLLKLALKIILQETKLDSKVNSVQRGDNNKQKKKKLSHFFVLSENSNRPVALTAYCVFNDLCGV